MKLMCNMSRLTASTWAFTFGLSDSPGQEEALGHGAWKAELAHT